MSGGGSSGNRRKLDAVYSALSEHNLPQAIKLSLRKDICNWDETKALRAHALQRLLRVDEALQLAREVASKTPTDVLVLEPLKNVFINSGQTEEAIEMLNNALQKCPESEDIARELYSLFVFVGDHLKQQRLGMTLSRTFDHRRYKFWTAVAVYMQVKKGGNERILALAERMIASIVLENRRNVSEGEVLLLVEIWTSQGKLEEALELLESLGDDQEGGSAAAGEPIDDEDTVGDTIGDFMRLQPMDAMDHAAQLLLRLDRPREAMGTACRLIEKQPDQWRFYETYFRAIRASCLADECSDRLDCLRQHLELAWETISQSQESDPKNRAAFLAPLELLVSTVGALTRIAALEEEPRAPLTVEEKLESILPIFKNINRLKGKEDLKLEVDGRMWNGPLPDGWSCGEQPGQSCAEELARLLEAYITRFSHKPACFADVTKFLPVLLVLDEAAVESLSLALAQKAIDWRDEMLALCSEDSALALQLNQAGEKEDDSAENGDGAREETDELLKKATDLLQRFTCIVRMLRFLDDRSSLGRVCGLRIGGTACGEPGGGRADCTGLVSSIIRIYETTKILNALATGGQREVQQGDGLLIVAADILLEAAAAEPASRLEHTIWALHLLERGVKSSPYNHRIRLQALLVYRALGAFLPAIEHYNELQVKQIQMDTLSYVIVPGLLRLGFFNEAQQQCDRVSRMHRSAARDAAEHCAKAVVRGNYLQGTEVMTFQRDRMDCSLQKALCHLEMVLLTLLTDVHQPEESATLLRRSFEEELAPLLKVDLLDLCEQGKEGDFLSSNFDLTIYDSIFTGSPRAGFPLYRARALKEYELKRCAVLLFRQRVGLIGALRYLLSADSLDEISLARRYIDVLSSTVNRSPEAWADEDGSAGGAAQGSEEANEGQRGGARTASSAGLCRLEGMAEWSGESNGDSEPQTDQTHLLWSLLRTALRAVQEVAAGKFSENAAVDVPLLRTVEESLVAYAETLHASDPVYLPISSSETPNVPAILSTAWLENASRFFHLGLTPLLLLLFKLADLLGLEKKSAATKKKAKKDGKKKGKKGRKQATSSAAAPSGSAENGSGGEATEAVRSLSRAVRSCIQALRDSLRSLSDATGKPLPVLDALPLGSEQLDPLWRSIMESQAQTCARLLVCARDKLVLIQDAGWD
uniref:N-terminal acetyltransferase B complex subunit NAA25 homolog n=1 Tax=Pinguiococcus pyrenoidosus TaxID=172671 RepID=A0A7R9YDF9_9STRA